MNVRQKQDRIFICSIVCLLLIACLLLIVMVSCGKVDRDNNGNKILRSEKFIVAVYDGCQYLEYAGYLTSHYTHKGNCNNPIHQGKGEN